MDEIRRLYKQALFNRHALCVKRHNLLLERYDRVCKIQPKGCIGRNRLKSLRRKIAKEATETYQAASKLYRIWKGMK